MSGERTPLPRIGLIGAGSTGIAIAKALDDAGLAWVGYEKSDRVGGNWVFKNANGMSSAYRSLHINTSRDRMLTDMERERRAMFKRYVASARHTMQVDFDDYLHDLAREIARGRARAKRSGGAPVIR